MVKRKPVTVESDDDSDLEVEQSPPPPKRARKTQGHEGDVSSDAPEDDGAYDVDMNVVDQAAEEYYEEHNEEVIRQAISRKQGRGTVAQAGVIHSLELRNFMCHRHLSFTFNQQINFIIGRNGSGKSAILSGLQIALGARTYLTGRGSSLKALVMDGQQSAEVTVKIRNGGPEAYKPDIYGKLITIHRKIKRDGSSTWNMRNEDGKIISSRKADLQEMSDHMNIQIDSPLNVLTQDAAKQFLSGSSGQDKYTFFLKGTQLAQLSEEYEMVNDNIKKTNLSLDQKSEIIPQLREAHNEAETKLKEAQKAKDQATRLGELKKELAWSHVDSKYKELLKQRDEMEKLQAKVPKYEAKLIEAEETVGKLTAQLIELEQALETDKSNEEKAETERKELQEEIKKNTARLHEFKIEEQTINQSITTLDKLIQQLDAQIAAENGKLQNDEAVKREQFRRDLQVVEDTLKEKDTRLAELGEQRERLRAQKESIDAEGRNASQDRADTQKKIDEVVNYQETLRRNEANKYAKFGTNVEAILKDIERANWHGAARPIGPLGLYVTLKDPTYRDLMQATLGQAMFQFVVSDTRDREQLLAILNRHRNQNRSIIIAERDLFDFSQGIPQNPDTLTPLHILDVTDEWVKRILINSSGIERTGLARTRLDADQQASQDRGRTFLSADGFRVQYYRDGGAQSVPLSFVRNNDPRAHLFNSGDAAGNSSRAAAEETQLRNKLATIDNIIQGLRKRLDDLGRQYRAGEEETNKINVEIRDLRRRKDYLEEQSKEEAPIEVAALEQQRSEHLAEKETIMTQFTQVEIRRRKVSEDNLPLVKRNQELRQRANEADDRQRAIKAQVSKGLEDSAQAKKNVQHWQDKLMAGNQDVEAFAAKLAVTEEEYTTWRGKALAYSVTEVFKPRQTDRIQKELEALEKALKQREKRHGASVEDMEAEVVRTKRAVQEAEQNISILKEASRLLKSSLYKRMETWHAFRRAIALRAKLQFQYHLSTRNYTGKIIFDHARGTLDLKVQTEDVGIAGPSQREKDPKSLSGGEKSYSQMCLLLALWESIGSPIRCLDEFDVFMDAINRGICMKLMIDTAKESEAKQYIFISPLETGDYARPSNQLKVLRMPDPKRGGQAPDQTSLPA